MSEPATTIGIGTSLILATGLAMDATVVATGISASLGTMTPRHVFRLSWHFGLFQGLMPLLGWLLGSQAVGYVDDWAGWIAFALLAAVGGHMIYEAATGGPAASRNTQKDPTRGLSLVVLSVGTSLDALAVGVSLALLGVNIWTVVPVIALVTAGLVLVGIKAGRLAGQWMGRGADFAGGLVLIAIGLKFLLQA